MNISKFFKNCKLDNYKNAIDYQTNKNDDYLFYNNVTDRKINKPYGNEWEYKFLKYYKKNNENYGEYLEEIFTIPTICCVIRLINKMTNNKYESLLKEILFLATMIGNELMYSKIKLNQEYSVWLRENISNIFDINGIAREDLKKNNNKKINLKEREKFVLENLLNKYKNIEIFSKLDDLYLKIFNDINNFRKYSRQPIYYCIIQLYSVFFKFNLRHLEYEKLNNGEPIYDYYNKLIQ